ncbi:MAG: hypothetical protein M3264_12245 [Thermoproteota archaeon]|nr:hypothetical protein [Thermoproteota archaeon]
MIKTKSILSVVGISAILLLAGGPYFTTMSLKIANAQASTLGEPILVEKGKITSQSQLGPNRTQFTFTANGTLNGSIEVTNTGSYVSTSIGNNSATNEGQGVISTKDGSETASYSLIGTDNITEDGKVTFRGSVAYVTNSTGNLSVLNNMVAFFKGEGDIRTGNFTSTEWELK